MIRLKLESAMERRLQILSMDLTDNKKYVLKSNTKLKEYSNVIKTFNQFGKKRKRGQSNKS